MKRERTIEEYHAQAVLLGKEWAYDPVDHTMYRHADNLIDCHDPDTMELVYRVGEDGSPRAYAKRRKRYA